jgi:hypothetical protein
MKRLFIDEAKHEKHVGSQCLELYKLWYTLADFFPSWNFAGFSLRIFNLYRWKDQRSCDGRVHYIF